MMNKRIEELAQQAGFLAVGDEDDPVLCIDPGFHDGIVSLELTKFAELIVYDFLSELTNDDALGEARIATIKRLAQKWGVARDGRGEWDVVTLSNLYGASASARYAAEDAQTLILVLMIKHLRHEHNMPLNDIAKRCGLRVKQVKNILGDE
jgi:hypothetical protein